MHRLLSHVNRKIIAILHDSVMAAASFVLAFYLRLGDVLFNAVSHNLAFGMVLFSLIAVTVFSALRLYRGLWRFASMQDLIALTKAATIAIALFYLSLFFYNRLEGMPRSVPVIHWMVLLGGPRFLYRITKDRLTGRSFTLRDDRRIPVLLIGANDNTEHFLRDSTRNAHSTYRAVGIIVDDAQMDGRTMHGVRIYCGLQDVQYIVRKLARRNERPQRIIVADEHLGGEKMRELLDTAERLGINLARLPRMTDFKSGMTDGQEVRPIAVEDLLGRAQNAHNKDAMQRLIAGKTVLVTGAGGTIGSELVRQIASFAPQKILLLEQSEFNLYQIDMELADGYPHTARQALLGDVRDKLYLEHVFTRHRPQLVFHAAAIKHVPMAEHNPEEAILTNIIGTRNVADACVRYKVPEMVLISTDKAVNPANVMGATKRLAESYCQALGSDAEARGETRFITVRFGNVLGSTGSVVPLFQKQLQRGGPITVTHPDMVRYFMTVREAVELVLQAAAMGAQPEESRHGLIFVVNMGEPVRIEELASQMIRLAGLKPNEDVHIVYTGLRPGEKLYEELFHYSETPLKTEHEGILLASSRQVALKQLLPALDKLHMACTGRHAGEAAQLLQKLVPEFHGKSQGDASAAGKEAAKEKKKAAKVKVKKDKAPPAAKTASQKPATRKVKNHV